MGQSKLVNEEIKNKLKFLLYTVPHTGTFFTFRFLRKMGFVRGHAHTEDNLDYIHFHPVNNHPRLRQLTLLDEMPLVVTARHPHLTFLSHLVRTGSEDLDERVILKLKQFYTNFLGTLEKNPNHVVLTLDCEPHLREKTLLGVADFLNVDLDEKGDKLREYAEAWSPFHFYRKESQGIKSNPLIARYKEDPSMIDRYDFSELSEAFEWYERVRVKD